MLRAKASGAEASVLLEQAAARLAAAGIESSQLDAQVLLADAARVDRAAVLSGGIEISAEVAARFDVLITRRAGHEPVAYIVGRKEFYSLDFEVSPDVLIPRPQTETVVDAALEFIVGRPRARVLDIGTGPGSIAIAVAANAAEVSVVAVDVCGAALAVAQRNAVRNRVAERIGLVRADVFRPLDDAPGLGMFDLVISNPPYVVNEQVSHLEADVRDFEPHIALRGGNDGLDFFRRIANDVSAHLERNGLLVLEVGAGQDTAVAAILNKAGLHPVRVINDLDGIARVVTARL